MATLLNIPTVLLLFCLSGIACVSSTSTAEDCNPIYRYMRAHALANKCNKTTTTQIEQIQSKLSVRVLPFLFLAVFVVGFPANFIALWVLLFRTKKLPSTILLINMTSCDLLLLVALPFRIVYHFRENDWIFGEPFCRLLIALFYGNVYGSVVCLAFIAFDRYIALVHPFGARTLRSHRISIYMSLAVWFVVLAAMVPLLVTQQSYTLDEPPITTCHDVLPMDTQKFFLLPYFATLFTICFLLPLLVVLFCYSAVLCTLVAAGRRYAHAVSVTVLVLVVFVVCLLPSNVLLLVHYSMNSEATEKESEDFYVPYTISLAISTFNNCLDPFIFYYVSEEFRGKVRQMLCCEGLDQDTSTVNKVTYSSSGPCKSKITLLPETR
ncbi:proteinase-activated receptor 4 [Denticeps clupeoides]|uniref:G-protein coupled receptors family 1 profile domain-containing protein n=1 Tax=Denticeps clupeoides TaxID=299321 RepID=A0AAY4CBU2_9TELE|nr:proteinase-activated receptor 4-like [Denticeps clupeoides]